MAQPADGVGESRWGCWLAGTVTALLVLACLFVIYTFRNLASTGLKPAKPAAETGLLSLPGDGPERMTFSSETGLRAKLASGRWSSDEEYCVQASPELLGEIEAAARTGERGKYRSDALWVEMVAERGFGASPCRQRDADKREAERRDGDKGAVARRVVALGPMIRIVSIARIRPLGCDQLVFLSNDLRCPETPRPEGPVADTGGLYPEAALRVGAQGRTTVRLVADSRDSLLSCDVIESSGHPSLDSATCDVFRKRPQMIRKQGRTEGYATGVREVTQAITWRLPERSPR